MAPKGYRRLGREVGPVYEIVQLLRINDIKVERVRSNVFDIRLTRTAPIETLSVTQLKKRFGEGTVERGILMQHPRARTIVKAHKSKLPSLA